MSSTNKKYADNDKRVLPPWLKKVLDIDVKITKSFVSFMLNFVVFRSLKAHCKFLEISCHGIAWIAGWLIFVWVLDNKDLYEMQMNMLLGLFLDIIIVALIKAATRRRRPAINDDMFSIGPDKFSFPSGHASRSFFILTFFTILSPISWIFWPPLVAWALSVSVSRVLMYRHHVLDVCAGILLGFLEGMLLNILWLGPTTASWLMKTISEDNVPGGPEAA